MKQDARVTLILGLICISVCLSSCGPNIPQGHGWGRQFPRMSEGELAYLRSLDLKNAESDARSAFRKGDRRFLGVNGLYDTPPGIDLDHRDLQESNGIRYIEGTSDIILGAEYNRLNDNAHKYAEIYNQEVLRLSIGQP